ncbi:putative PEP-CTERM system TPR-repeat lipoprotein [Chitinispirillum alkaliphilum]|nr:putative PEP-CTERM system TPR-repeat lipoprotein [Chitinispirillum alkaliphilum]
MSENNHILRKYLAFLFFLAVPLGLFADTTFEQLIEQGKYEEALSYADENIAPRERTSQIWVLIARANEKLGMPEKALASYLVSWRMNPEDYNSLIGAAKIYNRLGQFQNGLTFSQRALEQNFTAEASWEYARACIELDRAVEARSALEKVVQTDPSNVVATRELGIIYFDEQNYSAAIPLLKIALGEEESGEMLFRVGKAYIEIGVDDSALVYLSSAVENQTNVSEASLLIARANFGLGNHADAATGFDNVEETMMTASDYYMMAVSKENAGDRSGALDAYRLAVRSFGDYTGKEAILSRDKVGRADYEQGSYQSALDHFQFIAQADAEGEIVSDIHFLIADAHQALGNSTEAISSLERVIELDTLNIEAYARLADLYEQNDMHDWAQLTYETMISLDPSDPSIFLALGNYNLQAGRYQEAMEYFQTSNNLKVSAEASEGLAISAFRTEHFETAGQAAQTALGLNEDSWESRKILAEVLFRDQNFGAAQGHFEVMVEKEPENLDYLNKLAVCLKHNNQRAQLASTDRRITDLDKENIESRLRLAHYADSQNDKTTALEMYNDLALLTPEDQNVFRRIYEISYAEGNLPEAIRAKERYVELVPDNAIARRDLGDAYYEAQDYDNSLEAYRKAIALDPQISGFYQRYAEIVIAKGQHDEVIMALTGVINSGDADFGTYTTLGMIYQRRDDHEKAIDMYQSALQLDPQNTDALTALGTSQAASGDLNGAIISYEQAVMMNPDAVEEYRELGDIYALQNRTNEAMRAYRRYLDRNSENLEIGRKVGSYSFERMDYEDAVKYLGPVVEQTSEQHVHMMFAEASFKTEEYSKAISVLTPLTQRDGLSASVRSDALKMLAEAYEMSGDEPNAAQAYIDYISVPGTTDPDAAFKAAYLLEKTEQVERAIDIYENNIRNYPEDFRNILRLGLIYSTNEETIEKALPLLEKSTDIADSIPEVWLELARAHGTLGNTDEELSAYNRYVQFDPQDLEANRRIGTILMERGEVNEALISLEIANTFSPNDPGIMTLLAAGYVETDRVNEAIDLLNRAKGIDSENADIRFMLYELYQYTGQTRQAQREIEQLVELKQDNKYMLMYAKALFDQNNLDKAVEVVEDILGVEFDNIEALMLKGRIQRSQEDFEGAIETYEEIDLIVQNYAPALYERGETYMEMQRPRWAETFYNRAIRADPEYAPAELGLARMAKLRGNEEEYRKHLENAQRLDPENPEVLRMLRESSE